MLTTEEDARKKWCPMTRCGNAAGCNRSGHDFPATPFCIASECMAWRFAGWVNLAEDGSLELADDRHGPFVMPHGPTKNKHGCVHVGYCGAFGSPEGAR